MPLYDYRCRNCSKVTEVRHGFRETFDGTCPDCGSDQLARVFTPAGIVFKGSGFYLTDSRKPAASESSGGSSGSTPAPSSSTGSSPAGASSTDSSAAPAATTPSATPAASSGESGSSKKSEASAA
jgi:putative FmdB family regulatory protein